MVSREELKNQWSLVKNRLLDNWRELSDTELSHFNGTPSQLIGAIQQKTGASWSEVESFLANVLRDGHAVTQRASEGYDQWAAVAADYSNKVTRTVQRRPMESLAVAFGVGIVAGAMVLMSKRGR